jgi:sugar phosphate isomerase/epimerase
MKTNRRDFLKQSTFLIGGTMINNEMSNSSDIFGIKFFCPRWGANDSWDDFCKRVKEAGYDGIESVHSLDPKLQKEELTALEKYELKIIGQYYQSFESNFDEHLKSFEKHLRNLVSANPIFINSQTGKDWFSFEQNKKIFETAFRIQKETGVKIVHETHRGKCLFAAHVTKEYLMKIPDINLTLDISHWCNVHESLLADQKDAVDLALSRTNHIHSRVGHQEGPQINDPRAPEWAKTLESHLIWWDKVVERYRKDNKILTITTEFGPANYMPTLPYTQQPVANQFEINVFMMNLLKKRYLS